MKLCSSCWRILFVLATILFIVLPAGSVMIEYGAHPKLFATGLCGIASAIIGWYLVPVVLLPKRTGVSIARIGLWLLWPVVLASLSWTSLGIEAGPAVIYFIASFLRVTRPGDFKPLPKTIREWFWFGLFTAVLVGITIVEINLDELTRRFLVVFFARP
ncbi:MAG: hypothetical protein QHH26_10495 [Armatimonadota bacterium]|nr:hypothetical protein [Armatimonadota bacterium]